MTQTDEYAAARRLTRAQIAAAFGVPARMVGAEEPDCDCHQPDGLHRHNCTVYRQVEAENQAAAAQRNPEADVLDAIDALERDEIDDLVDAQLRQVRSGYDHNINQDRCPHCGGSWHGLRRGGCPGATGMKGSIPAKADRRSADVYGRGVDPPPTPDGPPGEPAAVDPYFRMARPGGPAWRVPRAPTHRTSQIICIPTPPNFEAIWAAAEPSPNELRMGYRTVQLSCRAMFDPTRLRADLAVLVEEGRDRQIEVLTVEWERLVRARPGEVLWRVPIRAFRDSAEVRVEEGARLAVHFCVGSALTTMSFLGMP